MSNCCCRSPNRVIMRIESCLYLAQGKHRSYFTHIFIDKLCFKVMMNDGGSKGLDSCRDFRNAISPWRRQAPKENFLGVVQP